MATLTATYTRLHDAFKAIAAEEGVELTSIRLAVAIAEQGGSATSDELEAAFNDLTGGSQVRRALLTLYSSGLAIGLARTGGRRRRGVRTRVTLTDKGTHVVQRVRLLAAAEAA